MTAEQPDIALIKQEMLDPEEMLSEIIRDIHSETEALNCLEDGVRTLVRSALPSLSAERAAHLVGVIMKEKPDDLRDLRLFVEEDFVGELTKIQARKLIRFIKRMSVSDSWNTAKCKFNKALDTSEIDTTDVENYGRGKRGEKGQEVSSSDSEDGVQILPDAPHFKQIPNSENIMQEQFHGSQLLHLGNQLPAKDASTQRDSESLLSSKHPSKKRKIEGQSMTAFEQRMLRSVELLKLKVEVLTDGMDFLVRRQRMQENPPQRLEGINDLIEIMPLSNDIDIAKMEKELTNKEKFEEMKLYLKRIGGANCDQIVRNIMKQVLTSNCALQYTFFGRREKGAFKETNLYKVIIGAVSLQDNVKDVSEYEINKSVQSWLRHAKARLPRKPT